MAKFTENEIKNRLVGMGLFKDSYKGVIAIHEDYKDDQKFWGHLFNTFFREQNINKSYRPFASYEGTGVDFVRDSFAEFAGYAYKVKTKYEEVDLKLVICVDADSKYLYEKQTWYLNKPYIFHTYAYSIENYNCFGEFLNQEFAKYSLNQIPTIDFVQLFKGFSLALSTLFCYWIYNEQNQTGMGTDEVGKEKQKEIMNMETFCKGLKNDEIDLQTSQNEIITEISKLAKECIEELEHSYGKLIDENSKQEMLAEFKTQYGIEEQELFLYFKGHWVFDEFLVPIVQYHFWYLKNEFFKKAENDLRKNQINNQFGETEAESNIKIKTIVEKIHEIAIHHKTPLINKIWHDLMKTTF